MTKVSVIVPVYNAQPYLEECLESIVGQTLEDIEIVCVNDGSTDGSSDILESFSKKDKRIKVISQTNHGLCSARNAGLSSANGEYVCFIESCVFSDLNALKEIYTSSENNDSDILIFQLEEEDSNMAELGQFVGDKTFSHDDLNDLIFTIPVMPANKLYKREFLDMFSIVFPQDMASDDDIFFWNALFNAERIQIIQKHYITLINESQLLMKSPSLEDKLKSYNRVFDIFKQHNLFDKFKTVLFNDKFDLLYNDYSKSSQKQSFYGQVKKDSQNMAEEYGFENISNDLSHQNRTFFNNLINSQSFEEFELLTQIRHQENEKQTLKAKNRNLKKQANKVKKENKSLTSSSSFKLTKPLRAIKNPSLKEKLLNRSGSYVFYRNSYDELSNDNAKLKKDVKKAKRKSKVLKKENTHLKSQCEIYQKESMQSNNLIDYVFEMSSKFDDYDEFGTFMALLKYKNMFERKIISPKTYKHDMARIDIKNNGDSNDLIILENSDKNARQYSPHWFVNEQGRGIIVESYTGYLDLKLKAVNDGNLKIVLRSFDLRDENDKRVNLLIEYTSLMVNGKEHLKSSGLYSHDHPFVVKREVEDSEIFDIHLEWITYDRTNPHNENIEEVYTEIRQGLLGLELDADILKKMPLDLYRFYILVLNNESYLNYLHFNDALKTNHDYVNKREMQVEIDNFTESGLNAEKRDESIIVSLTSFPERMDDIHFCLYSLLKQDFKPDEVILWLAEEQFPNKEADIPEDVLKLRDNGLTIRWCHDIRSYKKLIPMLKEYPDSFIVTADDDIYYHEDWLENIWKAYLENPNTIISSRLKIISMNLNNKVSYYTEWEYGEEFSKASYLNFPTGAGGTMYFPGALSDRVFDEDAFMRLCPTADDIWFWAMAVLNNTKIAGIDKPYNLLTYVNVARETGAIDNFTLWNLNKTGRNDEQLKDIFEEFPEILKRITNG